MMMRLLKNFAFVAVATFIVATAGHAQSSYPAPQPSDIDAQIENCKTYLRFSQEQFNFIVDELKYLARVKAERASLSDPSPSQSGSSASTSQDRSPSAKATSDLAKAYDSQITKIESGIMPKRKLLEAINYLLADCINRLPQPARR